MLSIWLAWHLMAKVDFLYPVWYDQGGIKEHIADYAPKNLYRHDFELTTRETRLALFHGMVVGIQNQGKGLANLAYQNAYGKIPLLTEAEIVHLQDVSHLISKLNQLMVALSLVWVILTTSMILNKYAAPPIRTVAVQLAAVIGLLLTVLFSLGAEKVFYQFHTWVFPQNHQWFFYYETSLMSTMMKAPDLFGMIAVALLISTIAVFMLIQAIFYKLTCNWH